MKTETKILLGIIVGTLLLLVGGVFFLNQSSTAQVNQQNDDTVYNLDLSKGWKIGSDSAKVKLVEFSDFQCPACGAAESYVQELIKENEANSFQFIYKHFPLAQHPHARAAANAAEAAGEQGKFWDLHHRIFATQNDWTALNEGEAKNYFLKLAKEVGADEAKVKEAMDKNQYDSKIQADVLEGNANSVLSTPTFYLNGKKLNLTSFAQLKTEVTQALAQ
jgi:protein-disulfide isomerase